MRLQYFVPALAALAAAQAPPPPVLLTGTKSGVDPVVPTPFNGVETIEGAIVYDGPPIPGFTGPGGNASVQSNLPKATYRATLPSTNFDPLTGGTITGSITGMTASNGTGVMFMVNFIGFPSEADYGPFVYHVHALPVPADGNCTATMGHLDPTNRGELHACDNTHPQSCQAGDLAGKHGNITAASLTTSYSELYLSTDPSSPYFFGDKSIVIHARNTTRLTCANFKKVGGTSTGGGSSSAASPSGTAGAGGMSSMTGAPIGTGSAGGASGASGSATDSSTASMFTGAAAVVGSGQASLAGGALGLVAAFFL